jgi:hypothetical protein
MTNNADIYLNGIDGTTGDYLVKPMDLKQAAQLAQVQTRPPNVTQWLKGVWDNLRKTFFGLSFTDDATKLNQAGWCIVFHKDEDDAVKKALDPLIEHRARQVGNDRKLKVLDYLDGETWAEWLARHGVSAGTVAPHKVPFYILIVGDPARIPFSFGHLLDVEYAVGRLHFDHAEEYASYVSGLIDYETGRSVPNSKKAAFFAPRHSFDRATQLSADLLVKPLLHEGMDEERPPVADYCKFEAQELCGGRAKKEALAKILSDASDKPPAFLFTASHGMGWPRGHARQTSDQGALLCQDWPGIGGVTPDHYFAAADIPSAGRVHGMITFHFACYGAGTPSHDRFIHDPDKQPPPIAERAFLSALPKRLLSHPNGGALASIGHVERAWGYSITGGTADSQLTPFRNAIGRILMGQPVGFAMTDFNQRYAALSANLSSMLERLKSRLEVPDQELASTWIERNDAEGYIVVGDPAARLRVDDLS